MNIKPIDQGQVTVLVDNVLDILSTAPKSVTGHIPNLLNAGAEEMAGSCLCCAHWGLSLVIKVQTEQSQKILLFDSGPEGYAIERNGKRLGIDFGAINAAMCSHGHWDHTGGMERALMLINKANGGQ